MLCISKYFIDICNYKLVPSPQEGHCDWASGEKKKKILKRCPRPGRSLAARYGELGLESGRAKELNNVSGTKHVM